MSRKLLYLSFKVNLTAILFVSALFVSAQTIWYCLLLLKTLVVFGNSVHQCGNKRWFIDVLVIVRDRLGMIFPPGLGMSFQTRDAISNKFHVWLTNCFVFRCSKMCHLGTSPPPCHQACQWQERWRGSTMCARWLTVLHHGIPTSHTLVECTVFSIILHHICNNLELREQ